MWIKALWWHFTGIVWTSDFLGERWHISPTILFCQYLSLLWESWRIFSFFCLPPTSWGIGCPCYQQRLVGSCAPPADAEERSCGADSLILAETGASFVDVHYWWLHAEFVLGTGQLFHTLAVQPFAMRLPLRDNVWVSLRAKCKWCLSVLSSAEALVSEISAKIK